MTSDDLRQFLSRGENIQTEYKQASSSVFTKRLCHSPTPMVEPFY